MSAEMLSYKCPACQKRLKVPPSYLGRKIRCPKCGERFTISAAPPITDEAPIDLDVIEPVPPPAPAAAPVMFQECPLCRMGLQIPVTSIGIHLQCPGCRGQFIIPAAPPPPAPVMPASPEASPFSFDDDGPAEPPPGSMQSPLSLDDEEPDPFDFDQAASTLGPPSECFTAIQIKAFRYAEFRIYVRQQALIGVFIRNIASSMKKHGYDLLPALIDTVLDDEYKRNSEVRERELARQQDETAAHHEHNFRIPATTIFSAEIRPHRWLEECFDAQSTLLVLELESESRRLELPTRVDRSTAISLLEALIGDRLTVTRR